MSMDQQKYVDIYRILAEAVRQTGVPITSFHAGGLISASRRLRKQLEEFETEVAARAKAEFESARETIDVVKSDYGPHFDHVEMDWDRRRVHPVIEK